MDLTIVIVNWNGGALLLRCLESIRTATYPENVAVVIVDNHSSDGSREAAAAAFPEYCFVDTGANLGFGRGNNAARPLVKTPLVLFLNPDTQLMPDTLVNVGRCLEQHPDVGALGCRMLYPDGAVQEVGLQWQTNPLTVLLEFLVVTEASRARLRHWLPSVDPNRSGEVKKLYGGFILARKEVLDAAGWFDDRYFMYAEDVDLSRTIRVLGWKLFYCSEATIVHVTGGAAAAAPSSFTPLMKQESVNKLIAKYYGRLGAAAHRAAVLAGCAFRMSVGGAAGLAARARGSEALATRWKASQIKHWIMALWALGLRRAFVPVSPSERTAARR